MFYFWMGMLSWILLCSIIQACVVFRFLVVFRAGVQHSHDFDFPKAAIILVIRGPDPLLERNIRALLAQLYPDHKLFVVVDHIEDPAWQIVERIRNEIPDRLQVSVLKEPLTTCSLKSSAMAQAIAELDASYKVVAFADGDTLAHKTWLRELVEPLSDSGIGVSTGYRWYLPSDSGLGSMTRYFWNAAGIIQFWQNEYVSPGSMALRSDVLARVEMVTALRTSLFDGPVIVRQIRRGGYKVRFVPSLMIANREQISLANFISWVERQSVVASSSGSNWLPLFFAGAHIGICVFAPPLAALMAFWLSNSILLRWALFAAASYWGVMLLSVVALEHTVRGVLTLDRSEVRWLTWPKALCAVPSILLAHLVPLLALIRAANRKTVNWRGIEYEIRGPDQVRMLNYRPFRGTTDPGESVL